MASPISKTNVSARKDGKWQCPQCRAWNDNDNEWCTSTITQLTLTPHGRSMRKVWHRNACLLPKGAAPNPYGRTV